MECLRQIRVRVKLGFHKMSPDQKWSPRAGAEREAGEEPWAGEEGPTRKESQEHGADVELTLGRRGLGSQWEPGGRWAGDPRQTA